jgi:hypothetical protein
VFVAGILVVLVVAALALRVTVAVGAVHWDEVLYWECARALRHGDMAPTTIFCVRYGVVVPLAAMQALFGETQFALMLVPVLYSLALLFVAYGLGLLYGGQQTGILAVALLAVLPLDVVYATDVHTDLPIAVFWAITMYAVKRGEIAGRIAWFIAGGLSLGLAYLTKEIGGLFLVVLLARLVWLRHGWRSHFILGLTFLGVIAADWSWMAWVTGAPLNRWIVGRAHIADITTMDPSLDWMLAFPSWLFDPLAPYFGITGGIGYLAIAAGVWGWLRRDRGIAELALWWGLLFLALNFAPLDPTFRLPLFRRYPRTLHPLILPLVLMAALWLACGMARYRRACAALLTVFTLVSGVGIWSLSEDRKQWAAVARQAAPLIQHAAPEGLVVTDIRSAWFLRVLLPARSERIVVYSDVDMARLSPGTLVLTDPRFLRSEFKDNPTPVAMLAAPPSWECVATLPPPRRVSVRRLIVRAGRVLGWNALSGHSRALGPIIEARSDEHGDMYLATLWRVPTQGSVLAP